MSGKSGKKLEARGVLAVKYPGLPLHTISFCGGYMYLSPHPTVR